MMAGLRASTDRGRTGSPGLRPTPPTGVEVTDDVLPPVEAVAGTDVKVFGSFGPSGYILLTEELLEAGRNSPARGYDDKDSDKP